MADLKTAIRDAPAVRGFRKALEHGPGLQLIAELKQASPSQGVLRQEFRPAEIAAVYQEGGATCLSILTEERFFQGHLSFVADAKQRVSLPVLQKDFLIDEYQLYEARATEADAVLLIVKLLGRVQLRDYAELADGLGLDCLVEVHTEKELERVLDLKDVVIGINNRDLESFETDLETTTRLMREVPRGCVVVSESGLQTREDVRRVEAAGVTAVLIGERFMRSGDIGKAVKEVMGW